MFNQIYCRMGSNQKLPISFITWWEKKTYTESPFWYRPAMVSRLKAKCGVDMEVSAPVPTSQVVGPWLSWAQEASKGDMHAICRGDGLFQREKKWIWEKIVFQFVFFWLLLKRNNIHQKGKKCSQPAQTNPKVGLPFFTNSKVYQEPSNGQQTIKKQPATSAPHFLLGSFTEACGHAIFLAAKPPQDFHGNRGSPSKPWDNMG